MKKLPWWKILIRVLGLIAALWALYDLVRQHLLAI
jgi:hypothetical protein